MSSWLEAVPILLNPPLDLERERGLLSPRINAELATCSIEVARDKILLRAGSFLFPTTSDGPAHDASSRVTVLAKSSSALSQARCSIHLLKENG